MCVCVCASAGGCVFTCLRMFVRGECVCVCLCEFECVCVYMRVCVFVYPVHIVLVENRRVQFRFMLLQWAAKWRH